MTTEMLRPVTGPNVLSLWPFQEEAIDSLQVAAQTGKRRIILCAPNEAVASLETSYLPGPDTRPNISVVLLRRK